MGFMSLRVIVFISSILSDDGMAQYEMSDIFFISVFVSLIASRAGSRHSVFFCGFGLLCRGYNVSTNSGRRTSDESVAQ